MIEYGCNVRINTYLCNSNKHCIEHLRALDNQLKVNNHLYMIFKSQGRGEKYKDEVIKEKELKNIFGEIDLKEYDEFIHSNVIIDYNGNVLSQGLNDTKIVGNIFKERLSDIYKNPIFNHKLHLEYHCRLK